VLSGVLLRDQYHRRKGCQSSQDAIKRRFNRVLARFTIWSIFLELAAALGGDLLDVGLRGRVDKSLVSNGYCMENPICEVGMLKGIYCRNCSSILTS
jgi:hypothetical protein